MPKRLLAVVGLMGVMLITGAAPAWAHGGGGSDATNFRSEVGAVVEGSEGDLDGPGVQLDGVQWAIRALDSYLEVRNTSSQELLVTGYEGEPYLRIGPDGVFENRKSPAVYLNLDRFAETAVPEGVSADAEPEWVEVAATPMYRWHDHRVHWMSATEPPQVATDRSAVHVIQEWAVPFTLGGDAFSVTGQLRWFPPPPAWPWVAVAAAVVLIPLGLGAATSKAAARGTRLIRVSAFLLAALVVLDVAHAVDDVLAVPATLQENILATLQSLAFIGIGAYGAVRGWRNRDIGVTAIGAGALALGVGVTHFGSLTSSQVASLWPSAITRQIIALNLVLLPPVLAVLAYVWRREDREARAAEAAAPPASPAHA